MTEQMGWRLERTVPVALLLAVTIQAAAGLMWAGRAAARIDEIEHRVTDQRGVGERLARLEALIAAQTAQLTRIEAKLDRSGS